MNQQIDNRIEKRHHRRKDHHKLVILESLQIGINTDSRMINCSDDGLYFESDQLLLPGTKIFIRIENFPHGQTETYICHHAKIIWGQRLDHTHYAYGYGAKYVEYSNKQESSETESDQIEELRKHPRKYCAKPATLRFEKNLSMGSSAISAAVGVSLKTLNVLIAGRY